MILSRDVDRFAAPGASPEGERAKRVSLRFAAGLGLAGLVGGTAAAHAVERGLILLLPTEYYLAGGAAAVAASFLALAFCPAAWLQRGFRPGARPRRPGPVLSAVAGWLGFGCFAALLWAGIGGARDPLSNPLSLAVWTLWWIGFTALVALVGDVWRWCNPWSALVALVRRVVGPPAFRLPARAGYWPAILGFGAVVWFEAVSLAPDDPARLARAAVLYWLVQFAGFVLFGRRWQARGEAFSVLYRLLGRLSPVAGLVARAPGARLVHARALPIGGWLFVVATIAGVTFDGLSGTFAWLSILGVNPLEFPGRSAVIAPNTLGLVAVWLALAAAYAGAVALGRLLAGRRASLAESLGRIALSLLPIALAYHLSHYLTYFMINGQHALAMLSDPLATGADLLGLTGRPVVTSFMTDLHAVEAIWRIQTGLIVGGHLLAVLLADAIAGRLYPDRTGAILSQVPLAILMVALTLLGLWLLSAPAAF